MRPVRQVVNLRPIVNRVGLVAGLALLTVSCGSTVKIGAIRVDSTLQNLVPADAVFVMGANIEAIRATTVYQKHSAILNIPRFSEFATETGLDPRKDLSQVISASNGKSGVLLARGKFNVADLEDRLRKRGSQQTAYKNFKLFGDEKSAIVFLDSTTAIGGSAAVVKSIIDQRDQPKHGMPPALADRIRAIPGNSQIWAGLIGGVEGLNLPIGRGSVLGNVLRSILSINSATLGIDMSNGLDLQVEAICKTEDDAKHIHDLLKFAVGVGRLSTPDNHPELLQLYDAIKVDQTKDHVAATAHIAPDLVDKFLDLWVKRG